MSKSRPLPFFLPFPFFFVFTAVSSESSLVCQSPGPYPFSCLFPSSLFSQPFLQSLLWYVKVQALTLFLAFSLLLCFHSRFFRVFSGMSKSRPLPFFLPFPFFFVFTAVS